MMLPLFGKYRAGMFLAARLGKFALALALGIAAIRCSSVRCSWHAGQLTPHALRMERGISIIRIEWHPACTAQDMAAAVQSMRHRDAFVEHETFAFHRVDRLKAALSAKVKSS